MGEICEPIYREINQRGYYFDVLFYSIQKRLGFFGHCQIKQIWILQYGFGHRVSLRVFNSKLDINAILRCCHIDKTGSCCERRDTDWTLNLRFGAFR